MSVMKCIVAYFKRHKMVFFMTLLIIAGSAVTALIPPRILKYLVDDVLAEGRQELILRMALLYTGSYLLLGIFDFLGQVTLVSLSQGISREIRLGLRRKISRLTYQNFTRYDSAAMEAHFNNDVATINSLITNGVVSMFMDAFKMLGILVTIFLFSWQFGILVIVMLPALIWFTMFIRKRMFHAQFEVRTQEGNLNRMVLENVENMQVVKSFDVSPYMEEKFGRALEHHFRFAKKTCFYEGIFSPVMESVKFLIIAALLLVTGVKGQVLGLSAGVVVALIALVLDLFTPVEELGRELQVIQKSLAGMKRIDDFFSLEEEEERKEELPDLSKGLVLKLEHIDFSYDGKEQIISDFSMELKGNERVVLKGVSGAGKSTIFKLAYGCLKPVSGRVTINGVDVSALKPEARQGLFGIVYQTPFFSGESLYEELTLHKEIPRERVWQVLKHVGLDRIDDLDRKFTVTDFSTGELSLLNIARVLLLDCRIIFLDEMNARIDPGTAEQIMQIMERETKDKMVFSINHYGGVLKGSRVVEII